MGGSSAGESGPAASGTGLAAPTSSAQTAVDLLPPPSITAIRTAGIKRPASTAPAMRCDTGGAPLVQVARSSLTRQRLKHEVNAMDIPALYFVLVITGSVSTDPNVSLVQQSTTFHFRFLPPIFMMLRSRHGRRCRSSHSLGTQVVSTRHL